MSAIKRILVPVDFSPTSQNALRYALRLADHWGAGVQLIHVVYPQAEPADFPFFAGQATETAAGIARTAMKEWTEETLTQVQAGYTFEHAPEISDDIEVGMPVSAVVQVARRDKVDLIVMGTQGEHSLLDRLFGSVSTGVVRQAECPVLVVPENAAFKGFNDIVYAFEFKNPKEEAGHASRALQLLEPDRPRVHCVYVQTENWEKDAFAENHPMHYFNEAAPAYTFLPHEVEELDVVMGLESFADQASIDLIVMYKPHESALQSLFNLSQTRRMVYLTHVPLLILQESGE